MSSNPTFAVTKRIVIIPTWHLPKRGYRVKFGTGYEGILITSVIGPGQIRQILLVENYSAASMAHYDGFGPMP